MSAARTADFKIRLGSREICFETVPKHVLKRFVLKQEPQGHHRKQDNCSRQIFFCKVDTSSGNMETDSER
jgi:hypothetical protein